MKTTILATSFLISSLALAPAATWHVDDSNKQAGARGTTARPFKSIQAAIAASANGDTIKVALGRYSSINTLGKSLTLLGGYRGTTTASYAAGQTGNFTTQGPAPSATIIIGGTSRDGVTIDRVDSDPNYNVTFDNFTVSSSRRGIVCDGFPNPINVTISRNLIEKNQILPLSDQNGGAGIIVSGGFNKIVGNIIRSNQSGRGPGIIRGGDDTRTLEIRDNQILSNTCVADHGGGVHVFGEVTMVGNLIARNRIANIQGSFGWGGGVIIFNPGSTLRSSNNIYRDNFAPSFGGGVYVDDGARAFLRNDLIYHNTTFTGYGAGVGVNDGEFGASSVELTNCTIAFNNVGVVPSDPDADRGGNGLYLEAEPVGTSAKALNCIFWGNNGDDFAVLGPRSSFTATYTQSEEGVAGTRNRTTDPLFVNPARDFRLQAGSPCVDTGLNRPWNSNSTDLVGNPRIVNGTVDRGSYERP